MKWHSGTALGLAGAGLRPGGWGKESYRDCGPHIQCGVLVLQQPCCFPKSAKPPGHCISTHRAWTQAYCTYMGRHLEPPRAVVSILTEMQVCAQQVGEKGSALGSYSLLPSPQLMDGSVPGNALSSMEGELQQMERNLTRT